MTPETFDTIIAGVEGGLAVRNLCPENEVSTRSFYQHLRASPENEKRYARAKEMTAELYAEECIEIADDGQNDWMERKGEEGQSLGWTLNGEHVQRSKLRIDVRKWAAAKLAPKKFGERIQHANDPENPLTAEPDIRERAKAMAALIVAGKLAL